MFMQLWYVIVGSFCDLKDNRTFYGAADKSSSK